MTKLNLDEIEHLTVTALTTCGAAPENALCVARSVRDAEAEGIRNVGLGFVPLYCQQLIDGKIDGHAKPTIVDQSPSVLRVDAHDGFAHPAYDAAHDLLIAKAKRCGLAALSMSNAYYNGVEGYFVRRLAHSGLVALTCTNAVSMVAPYGGKRPFFGTNPIAFGSPREGKAPLVVDLSTSTTAFVNVAAAASRGEKIPETWAFDEHGAPTTDAGQGLNGSLQPLGGAKGTGLALMVEILAAGLAGANWSHEVPGFSDPSAGPPRLGQLYMAIDPDHFADGFLHRVNTMLEQLEQLEGVRLPGDRRQSSREQAELDGIDVDPELLTSIARTKAAPKSV